MQYEDRSIFVAITRLFLCDIYSQWLEVISNIMRQIILVMAVVNQHWLPDNTKSS